MSSSVLIHGWTSFHSTYMYLPPNIDLKCSSSLVQAGSKSIFASVLVVLLPQCTVCIELMFIASTCIRIAVTRKTVTTSWFDSWLALNKFGRYLVRVFHTTTKMNFSPKLNVCARFRPLSIFLC